MNFKSFLKGLFTGAAIGAAAGVLMAPKSGKETREDIKNFWDKSRKEVIKRATKVKNLTRDKYAGIVEVVTKEAKKTFKVASKDLKQLKKDLLNQYEEVKKELKK